MAAASIRSNFCVENEPYVMDEVILFAMTSDQLETIIPVSAPIIRALDGRSKAVTPFEVTFQIETAPTSRCPVNMSVESKNATTGAVGIRFWGGDFTNMVVKVYFKFRAAKAGGEAGA